MVALPSAHMIRSGDWGSDLGADDLDKVLVKAGSGVCPLFWRSTLVVSASLSDPELDVMMSMTAPVELTLFGEAVRGPRLLCILGQVKLSRASKSGILELSSSFEHL